MRSSSSMRRLRPVRTGLARLVADRHALHVHDRRRQRPLGIGKAERDRVLFGDLRDRLQLGDRLQPRLRLPRLRRLVAEAVDEGLHVLALGDLLHALLLLQRLPLAVLALERIVAAAPEGELAVDQVDDRIDGGVEEVAVVADDDDGARIAGEDSARATACLRGRDSWSARRGGAGRARRRAARRAPRACASRRKNPSRAAPAPRRRSRGRRGCARRAPPPNARRCRRAAHAARRCGAGRVACSASCEQARRARGRRRAPSRAASAARSAPPARRGRCARPSAARSIRHPARSRRRWRGRASSCPRRCGRRSRPSRPRAASRLAPSISGRPAIRSVRSVICSMGEACRRGGRAKARRGDGRKGKGPGERPGLRCQMASAAYWFCACSSSVRRRTVARRFCRSGPSVSTFRYCSP